MKQLKINIENEVAAEYKRAVEKFGECNNSQHESYAVLLEEYDEAVEEFEAVKQCMMQLWTSTKNNKDDISIKLQKNILKNMKNIAINTACEFVQVAAMAEKALITLERKYNEKL